MSLDVKTFDGQINVFSTDHGAMQRAIFGQQDCIVQGCEVTISDNKIYVSHGWMVICGRLVLVNGQEIIEPDDIITTNGYIRLILNIDTSIAAVEGLSTQISWSWDYSATTTFTALTQEDVNVSGSVYKAEIAVAQISSGNITTVTRELMTAKCLLDADVIDNLNSTDSDKPLSAAQGKALNDAKVAISSIVNVLTSTATNQPASAATVKYLNEHKPDLAAWDNTTFNIDTAASYNFMLKRGTGAATSTGNGNAFGTAFPNACLAVVAVANGTNVGPAITTTVIDRGGFNAYASSTYGITYIAIGY